MDLQHRRSLSLVLAAFALAATPAFAQLGQLLSPGPLSRAHAQLEGSENCAKCHEAGRQVPASHCLQCHKPIAERIAQRKGVHRNVSNDCVSCHVEHAGRDGELRPFNTKTFSHAAETGFALEGAHAVACDKCHKTRSFITLTPACGSCHADAHKGQLGGDCAKCHSALVPFKLTTARFDHSKTAFPLEGAHRAVACTKCHIAGRYTGLQFRSCADCHTTPHKSAVGHNCASCHNVASWHVPNFDHARTGTTLVGKHATVACAKCHVSPATEVRLSLRPCAACHRDPHRGAFKDDCASCHSEDGFKGAPFNHDVRTRFLLQGKHRALACVACHKQAARAAADFRRLNMACSSCHNDPHRAQLGTACEKCHSPASFRVSQYVHPRFPEFFGGRHAAVACEGCHRGAVQARVYRNLSTECSSCHKDVHLGQFKQPCSDCHSIAAAKFAAVRFQHDSTAFPLTGKHKLAACHDCHKPDAGPAVRLRGVSTNCASCHKDVHLGQMAAACNTCHTTESFRIASYKHRNPGAFFRGKHATAQCGDCHKQTSAQFPSGFGTAIRFTGLASTCANCHADPHRGQMGAGCNRCHDAAGKWSTASRAFHKAGLFPLEGRHLTVACTECHRNAVFKGTPTRCFDCHAIRRQDDKFHQQLGNECEECHRPVAWTAVIWNHAARTGLALNGAHRTLACESCHKNGFTSAVADCASCHLKTFEATKEPDHRAAGFPLQCDLCHRAADSTWVGAKYSHTAWPLIGQHATATCATCHKSNVYHGLSKDCYSCHKADYDASKSPRHATAGFPTACEPCHRLADASWHLAIFDHSIFPLAGVHATQACSACHGNGVYRGTTRTCAGCHQTDYNSSKSPNHAAAGFSTACDTCHRFADAQWADAKYDHTVWPLLGQHAQPQCAACHATNVYRGLSTECFSCHQPDFNNSANPSHTAAGFPTICTTCHNIADPSWHVAKFAHTTFTLAGVHATTQCSSCHKSNVFAGTPRTCAACHQTDYMNTKSPNHTSAGFPTTCDSCHKFTDTTWQQGVFNHATFPLAAVHAAQDCTACHKGNVFAGTPRTCSGCHLAKYNSTTNPNHASAGFPTSCETCHKFTDTTWEQGVFNHATFSLAGVHATQACSACHRGGVYAGTPRTCAGCHIARYNATTSPNHASAGFPTTCETCHKYTDATWEQGVFNHATFPLAGAHLSQPCSACHKSNVYAGTPRTCVGCHQTDYNNSKNPSHVAAGFPTTCDTCHKFSDLSWAQAVFNHTWFPITSGKHAGFTCNECHNVPSAFSAFTCITCHGRAETDGHHRSVSGYRYDSVACYACHPTGRSN